MNIFDLVIAQDIVEYFVNKNINREPLVGEILFPYQKEIGIELSWIKGAKGIPVGLRLSAYDAKSIRRDRQGIEKYNTEMPFFKESMVIDEKMRQQLNTLIQTNNRQMIEGIIARVFDDQIKLIEASYLALEAMRMQALTTGTISLSSNGQSYTYDFGMPSANKVEVTTSWSSADADIIGDIQTQIDTMREQGVVITRGMCNSSVIKYFLKNNGMKNAIYVFGQGKVNLTKEVALNYIAEQTGLEIYVNDDVYNNNGTITKFVPNDTLVIFPEGELGKTHMGVTPEESDLMASQVANVALEGQGIAVTTSKLVDPVNVEMKVSMVALPSFDRADEVVVLDVIAS